MKIYFASLLAVTALWTTPANATDDCLFESSNEIFKLMKKNETQPTMRKQIQTAPNMVGASRAQVKYQGCGYEKYNVENGSLTRNYIVVLDRRTCQLIDFEIRSQQTCPPSL